MYPQKRKVYICIHEMYTQTGCTTLFSSCKQLQSICYSQNKEAIACYS